MRNASLNDFSVGPERFRFFIVLANYLFWSLLIILWNLRNEKKRRATTMLKQFQIEDDVSMTINHSINQVESNNK